MKGISLALQLKPVWFGADDEIFDSTELAAAFTRQERSALRFLIRPTSRRLVQEMINKHTARKRVNRTDGGQKAFTDEDVLDQAAFVDDMTDLIILDWEGLLDEDEIPLPCNRENKLALTNSYPKFGTAILESANWVMVRHERQKEESEKNLPGMPDGSAAGSGI
ncbi:MAG: hypothetical protein JRG97_13340 [Deltaproteobacteria bacterium]|nr:hypothetical protein [Deltaproteobacteria bacterium]MBW2052929.1 hypothetical protein [Deltaproteobacteria bacterium]MBW2142030.1 hypothetical protein [Deltaproteobacteria bacterium]MBW2324442.1 hypothetical protein [Deltaproteobacteria bacterium]